MRKDIYLDNAATTPVYKEVIKVMNEAMTDNYGNPGSPHALGENASKSMTTARKSLAKEIGAKLHELIFTSGATEANNLALLGLAGAYPRKKKLIISAFEHSSIYEPCKELKKREYTITEIPTNKEGIINLKRLEQTIDNQTLLVSILHGHNELGVVQDVEQIAKLCKRKKVLFHTDAVQSFGKERIDVRWGIDLLSASAHKCGGPKGIGFLYIREGIKLEPMVYGGSQERGIRPGTENVPGIVGFAQALETTKKTNWRKIEKLREYFIANIQHLNGLVHCTGAKRLSGHVHVSFPGADAEQLIIALSEKGIMCSARSACLTKQQSENRVLQAIGLSKTEIKGSLRFALNEYTTKNDVDEVIHVLKKLLDMSRY